MRKEVSFEKRHPSEYLEVHCLHKLNSYRAISLLRIESEKETSEACSLTYEDILRSSTSDLQGDQHHLFSFSATYTEHRERDREAIGKS